VPRRNFQAPLILVLLACGILLSATINQGTADPDMSLIRLAPLDAPNFSVESRNSHLILRGTTTSRMHETQLLQVAADHFGDVDARTSFRPGVILVDSWESTINRLLYTLAAMDSAEATMRDRSIEIRGVTSDARIFFSRLEFLREDLQTGFLVDADVVVVDSVVSFEQLCERSFSRLILEPVSFRKSSTEIRTASFVTLDRITEFAHDCRHATISITGHSDSSGDESWNQRLSLARAQAVANYIAQRGIGAERMLVNGRGSSEPVADNETVQGRSLNRRIEFELQ